MRFLEAFPEIKHPLLPEPGNIFENLGRRISAKNHEGNSNTIGNSNTANGDYALSSNTTGNGNTANGLNALYSTTTGENNTANGVEALFSNTTCCNTAIGYRALMSNTSGAGNTALGLNAGFNVDGANNVLCLGANVGGANVSDTTWIGNVYAVQPLNGTTLSVLCLLTAS